MILAAAGALIAIGGALAVLQPGDLSSSSEDTAAPAETTSTTAGVDLTTTTTVAVATSTPGPTETTLPGAETSTTIAGSGIGVSGPASGGSDGVADTGGESMLGAGLGLLGLGLVLRRAARLRPL